MRQEVLNYLFGNRSFVDGVALYQQLPGSNKAFAQRLNRTGETPTLLSQLYYELAKTVGIPEAMMRSIINSPLQNMPVAQTEATAAKVEEVAEKTEVPEEVSQVISLFKQYPFLQNQDCPPELKILVGKKVEAYYAYKAAHPKLFTAQTEGEILEAASATVENFIENRAIHEELDYYLANGTLLGKHPIFALKKDVENINSLSTGDLIKKRNATVKAINSAKANIAKGDKPHLDESRRGIIERNEYLLEVIDEAIAKKG